MRSATGSGGWGTGRSARTQASASAGQEKLAGHDADHGHRHRAEADGAADHGRVGPEHALPGARAEDREAIAGAVAVRANRSAERGRGAEHVEEAVRHFRSDQPLRLPSALGQIEDQPAVGCEALERTAVLLDVQEVRGRMRVFRGGRQRPPHHRDALRVVVGERPQEDGVDHAEEGRVGSDAEGQGRDRHQREGPVLGQGPQGRAGRPRSGSWRSPAVPASKRQASVRQTPGSR